MNFDRLFAWVAAIAIGFAVADNLDFLQQWVWKAQAEVIKESKISNWGSPRFFPSRSFVKPSRKER